MRDKALASIQEHVTFQYDAVDVPLSTARRSLLEAAKMVAADNYLRAKQELLRRQPRWRIFRNRSGRGQTKNWTPSWQTLGSWPGHWKRKASTLETIQKSVGKSDQFVLEDRCDASRSPARVVGNERPCNMFCMLARITRTRRIANNGKSSMHWKSNSIAVLSIVFLIGVSPIPTQADVPKVLQELDQAMVQVAQNVTHGGSQYKFHQKAAVGPGGEGEPFSKNFPFTNFFGDEFFKQFKQRPEAGIHTDEGANGIGSIVSPDGIILTNAHVVKDMDDITVTLPGKKTYKAKLIGADPESDIAVIKIDAQGLPTAKFGDSSKI